jgi:hypothetical protein
MSDPDYAETVTLIMLRDDPRTLSLADAVRAVMLTEDHAKRLSAAIIRERAGDRLSSAEIERIYNRPDFPQR